MLTDEDNELLARIGPGTPMGSMLRRYWLPGLLTFELPEPDGKPVRMKLLGEDLIAFRDSDGNVGVMEEFCLHRGASLYYGRNEECGMRCVYHGWKYDRTGQCVDMPNEPPNSRFKQHIRLNAYTVVERNGIVWVYMGERQNIPEPPHVEWNLVPQSRAIITKRLTRANWAQVFEGGIDSSHGQFLHFGNAQKDRQRLSHDRHPVYEIVDTEYGSLIAARRDLDDHTGFLWRVYQHLMPFYTMVPGTGGRPIIGHAFVPRDDVTTMVWSVTWHPTEDIGAGDIPSDSPTAIHVDDFQEPTPEADSRWIPKGSRENDYFLDWELQRTTSFSGIPGIPLQDAAMQESMGRIINRTREHLGMSDAGLLRVRRRWMEYARMFAEGRDVAELPGELHPERYLVRSASVALPRGESWLDAVRQYLEAKPGVYDVPALQF